MKANLLYKFTNFGGYIKPLFLIIILSRIIKLNSIKSNYVYIYIYIIKHNIFYLIK